MFNNYLKSKSVNNTVGIFTEVDIPKNKPVIEITGNLYSKDDKPEDSNNYLQVSQTWYIGLSGGLDDIIRHSCNPNCYLRVVGKRALLYSLYPIRANSELTFDYSTTSTETIEEWSMSCNCQSYNCRKLISGFQTLDIKTQEDYKKKGMVPSFIVNPIFIG